MKVLVFSDSHGRTIDMYDAIERECPEAIIHLGDCYEDTHELRCSYPQIPMYAVRGNNDWGNEVPWQCEICLENVRIYLTHGHKDRVSFVSSGNVPKFAVAKNCQLALFGHTHIAYQQVIDNILVLNPGSISLPRQGEASYAVICLEKGRVGTVQFKNTQGISFDVANNHKQRRMGWF